MVYHSHTFTPSRLAAPPLIATVHAWDYRRYVLRSLPSTFSPPRTPLDELRYTRKKIEANFSNFSAWHLRTKLLGDSWKGLDDATVRKEKDKGEFQESRVQEASKSGRCPALLSSLSKILILTLCPEFELVTQALWTDPADQSGWLYHRWLVGSTPPPDILRRELANVRELHETEPDSKCACILLCFSVDVCTKR